MTPAKKRFAGANTLALTQGEFELHYSRLAEQLEGYTAKLRGRTHQLKANLSVRLFARFLEISDTFAGIQELSAQSGETLPADLGELLAAALRAFLDHLRASGLYSHQIALSHAKSVGRIFRWLGKTWPRLYPPVKRVTWEDFKPADTRKNRSVPMLVEPIGGRETIHWFGETFAHDLNRYRAENGAKAVLGPRKVLSWLCHFYAEEGASVIRALQNGGSASCDPAAIKEVIDKWEEATAKTAGFSPRTISSEKRYAAAFFAGLSALADRSYPHFVSTYVKTKHTAVPSKSLADVDLSQTRHLSGAARLKRSREIVLDAAFDVLREHRGVFDALAPARTNEISPDLPKNTQAALRAIATVMQAEMSSLRLTGKSQFSTQGTRSNVAEVDRALEKLANPGLWRQVGVPDRMVPSGSLGLQRIRQLLCRGIGATRAANLAAKFVIACDKGWNRQPIESIPSEVYVFQVGKQFGIASASFLDVFKKRAGHDVLALIEHGHLAGKGREEAIIAAWEQVESVASWDEDDERALLTATDPAYLAIELIRPLVEDLAGYTRDPDAAKRFFKFLNWSTGVSIKDTDFRASFHEGILATPGVTFPAARKTVLQLKIKDVGSLSALRPHAGHAGLTGLLPSYLNSPSVMKELWQTTRFFQNTLQALTTSGIGKIDIRMSEGDQDWFFRLAHASGVASAVGFGVSVPTGGPRSFEFKPTNDEIRGLVALHLALIRERRHMPSWRRSLMATPLLGFVIALRRKLNEVGLASLVRRVSRQLLLDLREGTVVTPSLSLHGF
jgi:hypothetical protein